MMDPVPLLTLGLALATAIIVTFTVARLIRAPARGRKRVVEQPNSHYSSESAREARARHRWRDIDLDSLHEINREEVLRLLARVEGTRPDTLRPSEREFLDHLAGIAGTRPGA
ncbi:MAG TPA: hypothetical protein VMM83_07505 [Longimicrobiales bacterium]|nr:hypothetical protein [Longimicrobiales bacterium]